MDEQSVDHTFDQARIDLNYLCSKLFIDTDELPMVGETGQRIERALVVLKQTNNQKSLARA